MTWITVFIVSGEVIICYSSGFHYILQNIRVILKRDIRVLL